MNDRLISLNAALNAIDANNGILYDNPTLVASLRKILSELPTVDAVPVVRCKDCSLWCICRHSDNWFCADGTPINTASDFYDDKGKRLNNLQTYKSIYGERRQNV